MNADPQKAIALWPVRGVPGKLAIKLKCGHLLILDVETSIRNKDIYSQFHRCHVCERVKDE